MGENNEDLVTFDIRLMDRFERVTNEGEAVFQAIAPLLLPTQA